MLRNISFFMVLLSMSTQILNADYMIQLGLYKNRTILDKMVSRISDAELRSEVIIEMRGELYWAHSKVINNETLMKQRLSDYRKVFKDAFSKEVPSMQPEVKDVKQIDPLEFVQKIVPRQVEKPKTAEVTKVEVLQSDAETSKKLSFEERLKGNTFYVCFESQNKQIVKTEFDGQEVNYIPIVGDMASYTARYDVVFDRLYVFEDKISTRSVYVTLDEVKEKYLLLSNWHNRKKVNMIRYYYDLQDAMTYMQVD